MQDQDDARAGARPRVRSPLALGLATLVVLAVVMGVAVAATRDDGARDGNARRIYMFGDSLVLQASRYWLPMMRADGWVAGQSSYAGTNTCDWFRSMTIINRRFHPDVVVLSFGGNDLTKCMHHADGSRLSRAEFRAKYRRDTEHALTLFPGVRSFYLVAPPAMYDGDDRFAPTYRAIAAAHANVHFVDGGRILTPNHDWRRTLPCLEHEACTGPVANGVRTNVVRAPDRVHFCPVAIPFGAKCPVYSPGAYRYALTIADAIRDGEP